jgi:electron transport complex protein RnfG
VKRDGGQFDQFTGATVTPRAIVEAVHSALDYYESNRSLLFSTPAGNSTPAPEKETP